MAGRLYVGTSGFAYPEWKGDFYPADIRSDAMLGFYASKFPSVEINYTFQRNPSASTLARWISDTPDDFEFSPKANRAITHLWRLGPQAAEPLDEFLRSIEPLGGRLGAVLFQSHPTTKADLVRLQEFLSLLPARRRFAFEFRHETWCVDAVKGALAERSVAWCVSDTDSNDAPFEQTAPSFAYLRLRKTSYDDEALSGWAKLIGQARDGGADVYCYFKHEEQARGVQLARRLMQMLAE